MSVSIKGLTNLKDVIISTVPPDDPWMPATSLPASRTDHTATRLADGRYLVTGGIVAGTVSATTLIGTASGNDITWVASTALPAARLYHAASLLPDGRIVITGGSTTAGITSGTNAVTTVWIGTVTGNTISWVVSASVLTATRQSHTSSTLSDGRLLLTGGYVAGSVSVTTLFGTVTGDTIAWVAGTNMTPSARRSHTATVQNNGTVVIAFGSNVATASLNSTSVGTISGNTISWTTSTALTGLISHSATLVSYDRIAMAGGTTGSAGVNTVYYGTPSGTSLISWVTGTALPEIRYNHATVLMPNGRIAVIGGFGLGGVATNTVLIGDTTSISTWITGTGTIPTAVTAFGQTVLPNNDERVLVMGGRNAGNAIIGTTAFGTVTGNTTTWAAGTNMPSAIDNFTVNRLMSPDLRCIQIGGSTNGTNALSTVYYVTTAPASNTISWAAGTALPVGRQQHATVVLPDGRVVVTGGTSGSSADALVYIGNGSSWVASTSMPDGRKGHAAAVLSDGRIIVSGGQLPSGTSSSNTVWIGTVTGNTIVWVSSTVLPATRVLHKMIIMPNGKIVIPGGNIGSSAQAFTWIGTVTGNTIAWEWSTAVLPNPLYGYGASLLPDDRILLTGGAPLSGKTNAVVFGTITPTV